MEGARGGDYSHSASKVRSVAGPRSWQWWGEGLPQISPRRGDRYQQLVFCDQIHPIQSHCASALRLLEVYTWSNRSQTFREPEGMSSVRSKTNAGTSNARVPAVQVRASAAWDFHRWFGIVRPAPFSERRLVEPPISRWSVIATKSVKSELGPRPNLSLQLAESMSELRALGPRYLSRDKLQRSADFPLLSYFCAQKVGSWVWSSPFSPCHLTLATCLDQDSLTFVSEFDFPQLWLESVTLPSVWGYEEGRLMLTGNQNSP